MTIELQRDGFRWELVEAFASQLSPLLASPGEVVKESPVKSVTRHRVGGAEYYVKRYWHHRVWLRPLKFFFKTSQARQEWRLARELTRRQVPMVEHLALGERWTAGGLQESVLITRGFAGSPLDEAMATTPERVREFVDRLHRQGVLQRDLHPGNLLVSPDGSELRLVDLHGIVLRPSLTASERAANLAFLRLFYPIPVPPDVQALADRLRPDYLARRARRCWRHNREFGPRRFGRWRWQVRWPSLTPAVEAILRDPDFFLTHRAEILKPGRSSTVGRADGLVLKRFNLRKVTSLVKDLFRPSRARRAFRKAYHLELAGIRTARPIAAADWRVAGLLYRSYFLMAEIPGARDLRQWPGGQRGVIRDLARLVARLHGEGFSHRDLKETNLVIDAEGQPVLLDLEGLVYRGTVPLSGAAADLARLARGTAGLSQYQRTDRQCFLYHYCKARGLRPRQLLEKTGRPKKNRGGKELC